MIRSALSLAAFCAALSLPVTAAASGAEATAEFVFDGKTISITRDPAAVAGFFARFVTLDSDCAPDCLAPVQAHPEVETVAEAEMLAFFTGPVSQNAGLVVDARLPDTRAMGFIPGTVNLPYVAFDPANEMRDEILKALGVRAFEDIFNFSDAQELVVYDGGPVTGDAGRLIDHLIALGYPGEKIRYYHGGMQAWSALGLSIEE